MLSRGILLEISLDYVPRTDRIPRMGCSTRSCPTPSVGGGGVGPATFAEDDYTKARSILIGRYPGLADSDVIDEMVQRVVIRVWERRSTGRSVSFRRICLDIGADVCRDGPRVRSPRNKRLGSKGTRLPYIDSVSSVDELPGDLPSPLDQASISEFLESLSREEREIVVELLRCGRKRSMGDVAEMVGLTRQRVWHMLWLLRRRLRTKRTATA